MSINPLVSVKRPDKNGKVVTRRVRPTGAGSVTTAIPAPKTTGTPADRKQSPKKTAEQRMHERRSAAMDKIKKHSFNAERSAIQPSYEFEKHESKTYKFECTDNDFYTVLEHFTTDDAIVLMASGLKAEQIRAVRSQKGKSVRGTAKNAELVAELRKRTIPAADYCKHFLQNRYAAWNEPEKFLDTVECESLDVLKKDKDLRFQLTRLVEYGDVRVSDIKDFGIEYVPNDHQSITHTLMDIKRGDSMSTALEIRELIGKPDATKDRTGSRIRMAVQYGAEFASSIKFPIMSMCLEDTSSTFHDEQAMEFLKYADDTFTEEPDSWDTGMGVDADGYQTLWEAGIPVEAARHGLERGLSALQIIAVHQHGIEASVSDGWI